MAETQKDSSLTDLQQHTITHGWPKNKQHLATNLCPYWSFMEELTVINGVIYKGQQALVPKTMQSTMLRKIHMNHVGAESNIRVAREILFWPGMRQAISDMCDNCISP